MKRVLLMASWAALLTLALRCYTAAQSLDPAVLSKDANGPITRVSISLGLRANAACDETQKLIPDGSRLVSDNFSMVVNDKGIGWFRGMVKVVAPEGSTILEGLLHGTVGLTAHRDQGQDCRAPRHLEGMLEPSRPDAASVWEVNFSADELQESASPLPIYRARLDGLIKLPEVKVQIAPDRPEYSPTETITAIITNGSDHAIQAFDQQSYCTIVQLQRQENAQWVDVFVCPLNRAPIPTIIGAGETKQVSLLPNPIAPGPNAPGVYRLALTFTNLGENGQPVGDSVTVVSSPFRITAPPMIKVSIAPDRTGYGTSDPITAIITNSSDRAIRVFDEQSYCTIVQLQRQEGEQWLRVAACLLRRAPLPVTIGPGETKKVSLPPDPQTPATKDPGTHRLALTFTVLDESDKPAGDPVTVVSQTFRVEAPLVEGSVMVKPNRSSYTVDDRISATINNDTNQNIQTADHLSYCTILLLQRQMGDAWVNVAPCLLLSPTRLVTISAKQSVQVTLLSGLFGRQLDPGTYRVEFTFMFVDGGGRPFGSSMVVDSATFTVVKARS